MLRMPLYIYRARVLAAKTVCLTACYLDTKSQSPEGIASSPPGQLAGQPTLTMPTLTLKSKDPVVSAGLYPKPFGVPGPVARPEIARRPGQATSTARPLANSRMYPKLYDIPNFRISKLGNIHFNQIFKIHKLFERTSGHPIFSQPLQPRFAIVAVFSSRPLFSMPQFNHTNHILRNRG